MAQHPQTHLGEAEVGAKFDKKIKKKAYKILKDRVQLAHPPSEEDDCDNVNEPAPVNGSGQVNGKVANGSDHLSNGAVINGGGGPPVGEKISFNKWEATSFGNDAKTEKFRRLMGIKTTKPPQLIAGGVKRDDQKIFRDLETGFEKARDSHFRAKGMGLGFS